MIFATVGTQLPFDRLIAAVDRWAGTGPGREVFAQIGDSALRPRYIEYSATLSPEECREKLESASAVVAHAGAGTIISALELGKPLLVMPRRAEFGEHRNDHQLATAARFAELGRVAVAPDEDALVHQLDELDALATRDQISPYASPQLLHLINGFIAGSSSRRVTTIGRTIAH